MKILKKILKILIIILPIVIIIINNIPILLEYGLKLVINSNIKVKRIEFKNGQMIEGSDVKVIYNGETIIEAPKIYLKYSKKFNIKRIDIPNFKVIVRRNGKKINVIEAFTNSKPSYKKVGTGIPIKLIQFSNGEVKYIDNSYSNEIVDNIKNIFGKVEFDKKKGIKVSINGEGIDKTLYKFSYNNEIEKYDFHLNIENKPLNKDIFQYIYEDKKVNKFSGVANLDLRIIPDSLYGKATLKDGKFGYLDLKTTITDINGMVEFKGELIDLKFDYLLDKKYNGIMKGSYKDKKLRIDFKNKNIPYSLVNSYNSLEELNLPLQKLRFKELNLSLIHTPDIKFRLEVGYEAEDLIESNYNLRNIIGKVSFENNQLDIESKKILLEIPKIDYSRNIDYNINFKFLKNNISWSFTSNLFDFNGSYNKKWNDLKLFYTSKLILDYNKKTNYFNYLNLKEEKIFPDYIVSLKGKDNRDSLKLDFELINKTNKKNRLKVDGIIKKKEIKYNFNLISNLSMKLGNLVSNINLKADIIGTKKEFVLKSDIENLYLKTKDFLIEGYGKVYASKVKNENLEFLGRIREFKLGEYKIENTDINLSLKEKKLNLNYIKNDFIELNGGVDFDKEEIDLNYKIANFDSKKIKKERVNIGINKADGKIKGSLKSPNMVLNLESGFFEINDIKIGMSGKINYIDDIISTNNFLLSESLVKFNYNLKTKLGKIESKIKEENILNHLKFKDIEYNKLLGRVSGDIENNKLNLKFNLNLKEGYYKNKKIPNVFFGGDYRINIEEEINRLRLNKIMFSTRDSMLIYGKGVFDLKKAEYKLEIPKQRLRYSRKENVEIDSEIIIKGELVKNSDNFKYNIGLSSGKLKVDKIEISNIKINIEGDKKQINLINFIAQYQKNNLYAKGNYLFLDKKYKLSLKSKNIGIDFITLILKLYNINYLNSMKGAVDLDLNFSNDNREGNIKIKDFSIDLESLNLIFRKFNFDFRIKNDKIMIEKIKGYLNEGAVTGKGSIFIPVKLMELIKKPLEKIKYNLYLYQENGKYSLKDYFSLNMSSNLNISNNKITGRVGINKGKITKIYKEQQSLLVKMVKYIWDMIKENLDKNRKINKRIGLKVPQLLKTPYFNIDLNIKKSIEINMPEVSTIIQDLKGELAGDLKLEGKDDKLLLIGELELMDGKFSLGNEEFRVERAILFSNRLNGKIIDFNPNLSLEITSLVPGNNFEVSLQGNIKNLRLNVRTNRGIKTTILSNSEENFKFEEDNENGLGLILKTMVDSQISSTFFRPITSRVKKIFRLEKFRVVSDIFDDRFFTNSNFIKGNLETLTGLGAYLELENPLYKDKYYWNLKIGIVDATDNSNQNINILERINRYSSSVNQFNFKVEKKYKTGWSYGIGVTKLSENIWLDEKIRGKLNYYIDFKFKRKYNSIGDIFEEI